MGCDMMDKNNIETLKATSKVISELYYMFNDHIDDWKEFADFKVRYGSELDKFYLTNIDGSYEMSLFLLVHFILYNKNLYKKIFSKEAYKKSVWTFQNHPDALPDLDDFEKDRDIMDNIMGISAFFIGCLLKKNNFEEYREFEKLGYLDDSYFDKNFNSCFIFDNKLIYPEGFIEDIKEYMEINSLSEQQLKKIVALANEWFFKTDQYIYLSQVLYTQTKKYAKKLMDLAIKKASKKTDLIKIAVYVRSNEFFHDIKWSDQILKGIV
jgi:hypothetical protein